MARPEHEEQLLSAGMSGSLQLGLPRAYIPQCMMVIIITRRIRSIQAALTVSPHRNHLPNDTLSLRRCRSYVVIVSFV
uniref:Uncharacterized protein n=1 Tax=Panagrellus redivivus TaxID=6233 RepID=A0A7E4VXT3_PANRE